MDWTEHRGLVEYYASHRNRPEDLYPSERRFLPWLGAHASSVLDVGCGAGGFADIWRNWNPSLGYEGVDVSRPLVDTAERLHADDRFWVADAAEGLPVPDRHAEVVAALGWLHWEPRYVRALAEMWRATGRYLFFDLRVHDEGNGDRVGGQRLPRSEPGEEDMSVPYICVEWPEIAGRLAALGPGRILGYGYWGDPAATVTGIEAPVCFATIVLQRSSNPIGAPLVCLDMPLEWPSSIQADVRPASELRELIPGSATSAAS